MRRWALVPLLIFSAAFPLDAKKFAWSGYPGCDTPESAYYDPQSGILFVANVMGVPTDKDGNGFISALSDDGQVRELRWATGLNAPKGMRSFRQQLYVTDIDRIVEIDISTRQIRNRWIIEGARFLNDIAVAPDGTLYVSDTLGNAIYEVREGRISTFLQGAQTEGPNGLYWDAGRLVVATWGTEIDAATWSSKTLGRLLSIDLKTKKIEPITPQPFGHLDGLERDRNGDWIVSDWMAGKVFRVDAKGKTQEILTGFKGSADLGYVSSKNLLIVPRMNENLVTAYSIR